MHRTVTSSFKRAGNVVYLLGETLPELGGSLLYTLLGYEGGHPPGLRREPLVRYRLLHGVIRQGWVRACHDLSEGGLAVALAEMCIAGRLGAVIDISNWQLESERLSDDELLFSESNGRLLLEVSPEDVRTVEAHHLGQRLVRLGEVTQSADLHIHFAGRSLINLPITQLVDAWKGKPQ
jgi:phosphoribosylformylglycinamidine synthase